MLPVVCARECRTALEMSGYFLAVELSGSRGQGLGGVADEALTPGRGPGQAGLRLKG